MFKNTNIYNHNPLKDKPKKSNKDLILMIIILSFALYELLTITLTQNAIVFASEEQVNNLLHEPVIEDYSTDIKRLTFDFTAPKPIRWQIPKNVLVGNYNEYQKHWMNYAWNKWHNKNFLYMLKAENGLLNHDRRCLDPKEDSWGFCQINRKYHVKIVNDTRFFSDPAWQLSQCYQMFEGDTKFYGWERYKNNPKFARLIRSHFNF